MVNVAEHVKKWEPRLDLNPSSAERWTTCTASPQFIMDNADKLPPHDNAFNQEGTTAHEVAAAMLEDRLPRVNDKYYCPVPINGEMRMLAWGYMEYVRDLLEPDGKLLTEQKLPLWYIPGRNAIVDAAVINEDSLHIVDYKYGAGIVVNPENNLQCAIYAACVGKHLNLVLNESFPVFMHICQPRGRAAAEGAEHMWKTTWGELLNLTLVISKAAEEILTPPNNLTFAPSEKACQWCPAKGFCSERQRVLTSDIDALATIDSTNKTLPPVKAISVKQLCAILKHEAQIVKWLKDAKAYAYEHMKAGNKLPGYKLVMSRQGNRYWSDPKRAAKALLAETHLRREEVIVEDVISVAEAEKLLGKNNFPADVSDLISRPPGSPMIAPEDDKRPDCLIDVAAEFEVLTDELDDF